MKTNILFCGYSYHTQRYHSQYKTGFPAYLFRLQTEGSCEVVARGQKKTIEKGDLLLIKPGDHYELLVPEGSNSADYHLSIEGDWADEWWDRSPKPLVSRIELDEKLLSLWRYIMIEKRRPALSQHEELTGHLLRALCLTIERMVHETVHTYQHPYPVIRMMRYIEEYATTGFKIEDVAQHAGLSVSRTVHLFKSSVGSTIMEYAQEVRLSAAIERMKYTSLTLDQIAIDCGFGSYPYFHKVFKKRYGVPPGQYRRNDKGLPH
ncbi:AraC family transcriptional regulator [Mesobacillus foraminis]|uniref:AraC family transcriptional regulator n=1 Tax=Mesobacillus foraminis TaxID=279826 RepID=UPI000EF44FCA|nr:AraC family transcriptional regulator [Mesobacillus foraminis]